MRIISRKWKIRLGLTLITISVLIFLTLFAIPFLGIDLKFKLSILTALAITGEVFYWIGVLLIGKEAWKKFKELLKSGNWLEKKKEEEKRDEL